MSLFGVATGLLQRKYLPRLEVKKMMPGGVRMYPDFFQEEKRGGPILSCL